MNATQLKTEYLTDPVGIGISRPRLFWNCEGGERQTAFQIAATDDSGMPLWDSGRTQSRSMRAEWGGSPVPPKTKVLWKVRLWDENDVPGPWRQASFETGIDRWQADWITGDYKADKKRRYPVDCFRKTFSASGVKKARLYICLLYTSLSKSPMP